jgi:hypothetical protein
MSKSLKLVIACPHHGNGNIRFLITIILTIALYFAGLPPKPKPPMPPTNLTVSVTP